jgi:diguanylate cyclase (GGDEF)-like protein/PAS domain S-box-containing protein
LPNKRIHVDAASPRIASGIAARNPSRRRFGFVLLAALLIAGGTAQAIAALRSGADQSREAATLVARLEAHVQRQASIRWQAVSPGADASALDQMLESTSEAVSELFRTLETIERASFGLTEIKRTALAYQEALATQIDAVNTGGAEAGTPEQSRLVPALDAFMSAREAAAVRLEESAAGSAQAADLGTLSALLSAAVLISLLFRKWERAHRRGAFIDGEAAGKRLSEVRFQALVQHSSDLISVIGPDGRVSYASPSIETLLGAAEPLVGASLADMVHPDDIAVVEALLADRRLDVRPHKVEWRIRHASGEWRTFENIARAGRGTLSGSLIVNSRDITERMRLEGALRHQANHDALTGLGNRSLLLDGLRRATARADRNGTVAALLLLDLDSFKSINDSLGHAAGDHLLQGIAERLRSAVRADALIARIGGDEFAVVVEDLDAAPRALDVAARIQAALRQPLVVGERTVNPSASIGIATNEDESLDVDMLMRHADIAMYAAKRSGPGEFAMFEATMREAALERLELETDLRRAVDTGEIVPHYQAIFDLTGGAIVGFEALARWVHPARGIVAPGTFLPVAEQIGLVTRIDEIMLRQATAQLAAWNADRETRGDRWMSVNLSARQLTGDTIVDEVSGALGAAGLAHDRLVLELTESSVGSDPEASARTLERLRMLGLRLAIDDFGTGYSSLGQLQRFPFDILKVDRSFVAEPDTANALAPTIIDLANRLNLTTIAEGIETPDQLERVRGLGCGLGQGFLMHRPATAEAVTRQLRAHAGAAKSHEHQPTWAGALAS